MFELSPDNRLGRGLVKTRKRRTLDVALHMLGPHTPTPTQSSWLMPGLLSCDVYTQDCLGGALSPTNCMFMSFFGGWRRGWCLQTKARHPQGIIQPYTTMSRPVLSVDGKHSRDTWQGRKLASYVLPEYFPQLTAHLSPYCRGLRDRKYVVLKMALLWWSVNTSRHGPFPPSIQNLFPASHNIV